jgi:hypothetical protein
VNAVIAAIISANNSLFQIIPYVIIEACMQNRREYKVVIFDETVQYLSCNPKQAKPNKSFSKKPHKALFEFAHQAVQDLKRSCPEFISDGLVRVDIFQDKYGDLVVNEFESLEATYYSLSIEDMLLKEKLTDYWISKIQSFVCTVNDYNKN